MGINKDGGRARARGRLLWLLAAVTLVPAARADTADYLAPSVAIGGVYNDNLFLSSSDRQSDEILRVSPALEAGYGTDALSLAGYYSFDAERYRHHAGLDGNAVRRNAAFTLSYQATPRLDASLDGNYTSTETPSELSPQFSLGLGRAHATYWTVSPSLGYAFDELTYGKLGYSHEQQQLAQGPQTRVDTGTLGLEHRLTPRDVVDGNFAASRYDFSTFDIVHSRVFTAGWTHDLTPTLSASAAAGPRDTEGTTTADFSLGLHQVLDNGDFTLQYDRTQAILIGEFQPADARSLTAKLDYDYDDSLEFIVAPSYSRDIIGTARATLYRFDASFNYRLSRVTSLVGAYEYSLQQGLLTGSPQRILNNVVYIGLEFSKPVAGASAFLQRRGNPFETLWPAPRPDSLTPPTTSPINSTEQQNENPPP